MINKIQQNSTRFKNFFVDFMDLIRGKFTGVIFSIIGILIFMKFTQSFIRNKYSSSNSAKTQFLYGSLNAWYYILIFIIVLHFLV